MPKGQKSPFAVLKFIEDTMLSSKPKPVSLSAVGENNNRIEGGRHT